ncbi:conserved protein, unknown function [Hepatocystis sp. ex Piliocolobus tephrosceles]|nr:conserved protein, unknown function [Hepatocystis sp. ex Piliocolobus tephrosceles]
MRFLFKSSIKRSFTSVKVKLESFEQLSTNFIQCIEKYRTKKDISIESYKNYKKEIKECINSLFSSDVLTKLGKKDFKIMFTYCIMLSKRIMLQKDDVKNMILCYIQFMTNNNKNEQIKMNEQNKIDSITNVSTNNIYKTEVNDLLLILKFIFYLNVEYDTMIYNYIYSELSNMIVDFNLSELIECVQFISLFKNKKWINNKVFYKFIDEIIKRNNEIQNCTNKYLITIIKSISRLNYEINNIQSLLDSFKNSWEQEKDIHLLIKVIYNLFLCNYYHYKNMNQLITILKEELVPTQGQQGELTETDNYKISTKYPYNHNIILDTNSNGYDNKTKVHNTNVDISYDNINNIHQLYFNTDKKQKDIIINDNISSINLYRLKFIDILIRSDNYLYNHFYLLNSHFFDFIKKVKIKDKNIPETVFSKQAKFFIKENGFKIKHTYVSIYPIYVLLDFKNIYVELVHQIFINKKLKDNLNKFHKHNLNYKIKNMKFLGWEPILLYEHEWKKLRNYNEKFEYIKKALKKYINVHTSN